jgi:hypothetical protein
MIASHLISAQMQSPLHCESHSPLGIPLVGLLFPLLPVIYERSKSLTCLNSGPPLPLDMEIKQSYKIPFVPHTGISHAAVYGLLSIF